MQEKKRKQAETERKRAEVRARLEEASKAKKAKKGFMTPDRKKKLRVSPPTVFFLLPLRISSHDQVSSKTRGISYLLKTRVHDMSTRISFTTFHLFFTSTLCVNLTRRVGEKYVLNYINKSIAHYR